jgi:FkbH-like protein
MNNKRQDIDNFLCKSNYSEALNTLFSIIADEPSLANYSFASSKLREFDLASLNFSPTKIAILSSFTIESVIPYLHVKCCETKLDPRFYIGGYNLYQQEIINQQSGLYEFDPDVLILAIRIHELSPAIYNSYFELSQEQIIDEINAITTTINSLINSFRKQSSAAIILHNFETPSRPIFGIADFRQPISQKNCIYKINMAIEEIAKKSEGVYILDYDGLTSIYGKQTWQDDKMWLLAKMPIAGKNWIHLANEYMAYLKPLKGLNKKCLVLDLDNTLWGGIIGEDGIDGIKLGHTYPGNIYMEFQKEILKLYNRGIILAINSKNNKEDALKVFEKHPNMILKKNHIASWRVNWQDKSQNMREMAEELNIGLDSIVFMDDSPVEREKMKMNLPEVLTIDMPNDPTQYCTVLKKIIDFESLILSEEDKKRGEIYRAQIERNNFQKNSASLEDFYRNLDMVALINLADSHSIPRISQLTQRTNQFNLTTKRYSESEIRYFVDSQDYLVFYLQLIDRFGDNGIVGSAILKMINESEWEIDSYLLSCRILGRMVETAFLSFLVGVVKARRAKKLYGVYIPTKKNQLAKNFFESNKFIIVEKSPQQNKYLFDVENQNIEFPKWIKLETKYEK